MDIQLRGIDGLTLDPANARKHSARNIAAISESLSRFGQRRPAVIRSDGTVLAGNGMLEAARALGWSEVAVTVVPDGWSPEEARAYALADNRTAELAEWDQDVLRSHLVELEVAGWDVDALGFDAPEVVPSDPVEDAVPEVPAVPVTVLGDLWQVGPHRIICGDSSDPAVLDRLLAGVKVGCLLTDPPYGMNLDADYSKMPDAGKKAQMVRKPTKYRQVIGDDAAFDASFIRSYFASVSEQFWFGADYYRRTLTPDDRDGSWLIWDKRKEDGTQDDVLGSTFETCWSAQPHQRRMLRHYWCGAFGAPEARNRYHPTQKPVGLLSEILTRWTKEGAVVADPYAGSGATLVAAAQTGRIAYGVELDPAYVDVIVARLERETGETAVRVDG